MLGVWVDGSLTFNTAREARKARNLSLNPHVAITAPGTDYDFVLEGVAALVRDVAALNRVASAFPAKYPWWHPTVRDGAFVAAEDSGPRDVLAVGPRVVFGFGKASGFSATRWSIAN